MLSAGLRKWFDMQEVQFVWETWQLKHGEVQGSQMFEIPTLPSGHGEMQVFAYRKRVWQLVQLVVEIEQVAQSP